MIKHGNSDIKLKRYLQLSGKIMKSVTEAEVVEGLLNSALELTDVGLISYVPLDDYNQPMSAITRGVPTTNVVNAWMEYIASPAVRAKCRSCSQYHSVVKECSLLSEGLEEISTIGSLQGIFCLPVSSNDKTFGILNLFIPENISLNLDLETLLSSLICEAAIKIEIFRLQDIFVNNQSNQYTTKFGIIEAIFVDHITHYHQLLNTKFIYVKLQSENWIFSGEPFVIGVISEELKEELNVSFSRGGNSDLSAAVLPSRNDLTTANGGFVHVIPIQNERGDSVASVVLGKHLNKEFNAGEESKIGEIIQVINNFNNLSKALFDFEKNTQLQERKRIAREIHDGLAQTLGLLKLQSAQLSGFIEDGNMLRAKELAPDFHQALSEAYDDTREAIDNLRADISGEDIHRWLNTFAAEFKEISSMEVVVECSDIKNKIAPEINIQLARIVQEALSNIRKHSDASMVWLNCSYDRNQLILDITDNGVGFSVDDIRSPFNHGLIGMQERTKLIGAELIILSERDNGTTIRVLHPSQEDKGEGNS